MRCCPWGLTALLSFWLVEGAVLYLQVCWRGRKSLVKVLQCLCNGNMLCREQSLSGEGGAEPVGKVQCLHCPTSSWIEAGRLSALGWAFPLGDRAWVCCWGRGAELAAAVKDGAGAEGSSERCAVCYARGAKRLEMAIPGKAEEVRDSPCIFLVRFGPIIEVFSRVNAGSLNGTLFKRDLSTTWLAMR